MVNTSLNFIEGKGHGDYIEFGHGSGNNSCLGKIGGKQRINIAKTSYTYGVIGTSIHEICHALGLYHEQCRADRDDNIIVNWSNIRPAKAHNFKTYVERSESGMDLGEFDYNSIMLYSGLIRDPLFVYDVNVPVMTKLTGEVFYAQRSRLSDGDIEALNAIYGAPYSRTEFVVTLDENEDMNSYSHSHTKVDYYLNFYSDKTYKTRQYLKHPRIIRIVTTKTYINQGYSLKDERDVVIPAGVDSYYLGEAESDVETSFGEDSGYSTSIYVLP